MPSRLRVKNIFGERHVESSSKSPKNLYVISIAGEGKTEEQYFDGLYNFTKTKIIRIERLEKIDDLDTKSHPKHVIELLEERKNYWERHGLEPNELWMVVDRDKQNVSKNQLKEIIERCDSSGYNLALSNPTFEFWLLLHLTSIETYDKNLLLSNSKANPKSKKRYLEKELSNLLDGYNKNKINFQKFQHGIKDAVNRSKELPTQNNTIIEELGTSVGLLVEKIIL
jgi:hypothetical protein